MSTNRYFADVSSNNPSFDAGAYRHGGHLLIAIKATEATGYVNPFFERWAQEAHSEHLAVAHYHFAHPANDPRAEAEHFWSVASRHYGPRDYAVLDIEISTGEKPTDNAYVRGFDRRLAELSGHQAIGYSSTSYLDEHGPSIQLQSGRWWIADWAPRLTLPRWLSKAWAWQRTNGVNGPPPYACAGVGRCDVSQINVRTYLKLLATRHR